MNTEVICGPCGDAYEQFVSTMPSAGDDFWFEALGTRSDAGVRVTPAKALEHPAVWQGVNILSGDIGQLPVKLYQRVGENRNEIRDDPAIFVLREPNKSQTASVWRETMMARVLIYGNAVAWIRRNGRGEPFELIPLHPEYVSMVVADDMTNDVFYIYATPRGAHIILDPADVFHIQGLASLNGVWGIPLIEVASNTIGHGLAMMKYSSKFFANGARPGGVLEAPQGAAIARDANARSNLRNEWNRAHQGGDNSHNVAILCEGIIYKPLSSDNESAQLESLLRFDRENIASLLNLPAFKLNALENSSVRANLEEQNRDYNQTSLSRWSNRFNEESARKLLTPAQRKNGYYYRTVTESFLRGDIAKRYEAMGTAITYRWMSPNEVRELEDMNPYEGGDVYGNPNIDVMEPAASSTPEAVIERQMRRVVKTESNDVRRGGESKNFLAWLDAYYLPGGGFDSLATKLLAPVVETVAAISDFRFDSEAWARAHAVASHGRLLSVAGRSTPTTIQESITEETKTWHARAKL